MAAGTHHGSTAHSGRRDDRRRAAGLLAGVAVVLASATVVGVEPAAAAAAHITSVQTNGTPAHPTIVVTGTGFGAEPAPNPSVHPEGHFGCPDFGFPKANNGFNYGNRLYLTDLDAARGMPEWTAGQAHGDFFDCVGVIIDSWSKTRVVFHFGNAYNKHEPQNFYVLSNGDPIQVTVAGATFKKRVKF